MAITIFVQRVLLVCLIGLMQTPGPPGWDVLAQESNIILLGVVESKSWVVRKDKMGGTATDIPNPENYLVGSLYHVRVDELLKRDKRIKTTSKVTVFVPGFMVGHGSPIFVEGRKYILFLRPLKPDGDTFASAFTYKPGTQTTEKMAAFNPESKYVVVGGDNGLVEITEKNIKIIAEVKAALSK